MRELIRPPVFREDGTIEIQLTQGRVAIIDAQDAHLAQHNWRLQVSKYGTAYAVRCHAAGYRLLHREVLGLPPGAIPPVDHEDGDGLNCRRGNLRISTPLENARNKRGPQRNNTSGHAGVSWSKRHKKWVVTLGSKRIGRFSDILDAVDARLKAEAEEWGIQPRRMEAFFREFDPDPTGYGN